MYGGRSNHFATPEMFVVLKTSRRPCHDHELEEAYSSKGASESTDVVCRDASDAQLVS